MAIRDTQDELIFEVPGGGLVPGGLRDTQDSLIYEAPGGALAPGHLRDSQDSLVFEYPFMGGMFQYQALGAFVVTTFTPEFPPIRKQPLRLWGMEALRADSIASDGQKQSMLDHLVTVTTLYFDFVSGSDMAAWKAFEQYALTGGKFGYCPLPDYNGATGDPTGFSEVELVSMEWTPKFESFGNFSLTMKLKLVREL